MCRNYLSRQTYRTAVSVRHSFTPRITAGLNVAYQNDDYDGNFLFPGFTEDSFDISLSVRYAHQSELGGRRRISSYRSHLG